MRFLVFELAGRRYALPAEVIEEVRDLLPVTPVPFAPPFVDGLIGAAGRVLLQIDLRRRLDLMPDLPPDTVSDSAAPDTTSDAGITGPDAAKACRELLVVRAGNSSVALAVDHAVSMITLPDEVVHRLGSGPGTEFAAGAEASTGAAGKTNAEEAAEDEDATSAGGAVSGKVADDAPGTTDNAATNTLAQDLVAGNFAWGGDSIVVLRPECFGLDNFAPTGVPDSGRAVLGSAEGAAAAAARVAVDLERLACLAVETGGESFALPLERVQEVYESGPLTPLPNAPPGVLGLSVLRGKPRLALSLATLLGLPADSATPSMVMTTVEGETFVLGVSRVLGIRRYARDQRENVGDATSEIDSYLMDADGTVSGLIALDRLLVPQMAALRRLLPTRQNKGHKAATPHDTRRLLTFHLGTELAALDVARIERVAEYKVPEPLPAGRRPWITGMVEIGGQVLAAADLRTAMGIAPAAAPNAYLVVRLSGGSWALAVDQPGRLISLPVNAISPAATPGQDVVTEIGRLDGSLIAILDPEIFEQGGHGEHGNPREHNGCSDAGDAESDAGKRAAA